MLEANVELTNVVQVMLRRRLLPCQHRATPMWAHNLDDPPTMRKLYRTTKEKLWKALFKPQKDWLAKEEDTVLAVENPPLKV